MKSKSVFFSLGIFLLLMSFLPIYLVASDYSTVSICSTIEIQKVFLAKQAGDNMISNLCQLSNLGFIEGKSYTMQTRTKTAEFKNNSDEERRNSHQGSILLVIPLPEDIFLDHNADKGNGIYGEYQNQSDFEAFTPLYEYN